MGLVEELRRVQKAEIATYYGINFYAEIERESFNAIKEDPSRAGCAFHIKEFAVSIVEDPERINSEHPRKIITATDRALVETIRKLEAEGLQVTLEVDYDLDDCAILSVYWCE